MPDDNDFVNNEKNLSRYASKQEKKCMVCGKPSHKTICASCEAKIRGEALEHKQEVEKAGKTDTGRK